MVQDGFSGGRTGPAKRSSFRRFAGALALLLAAAVPSQAATPTAIPAPSLIRATPALWEVRDADTTIYLFGTFHTLDGRTVWFGDKVRHAFDQSGELMLETIVPTDMAAARAATRDQVTDASASPGGPRTLKPFIAQTQVAISHGSAMGLSIEHGADTVLRRVAEAVGKPVGGLERFEDQLGALARIPVSQPVASAPAITVTLNDLLAAWTSGNMTAYSTMLAGMEAKTPAAYRMLFAERNARWGQWIANRLDKPGTVFVAVGSGHLAGKDSVQEWLAARGIEATRVG